MFGKLILCLCVCIASGAQPPEAPEKTDQDAGSATTQTVTEEPQTQTEENAEPKTETSVDKEKQSIKIDAQWQRLGKNQIWVNSKTKQIMVRGSICLRKGQLEMFACPLRTKEHESIVAVECKSSEIHATLVALGFGPGKPVQWQPEYKSASGPKIKIDVRWKSGDEEKTVDAKSLVQKAGTEETLDIDWVFGGSEIFVDRVENRDVYYADSGEMICLSNFPTAMMDVPIESSDNAEGLLFEAKTDAIPALKTQVYLIMTPRK